jgi:hypothetical protein
VKRDHSAFISEFLVNTQKLMYKNPAVEEEDEYS